MVLGVERRRRLSAEAKARLVEETLASGAVVSEVVRRHGVSQSLLFAWRRQARADAPSEGAGSFLLPVEVEPYAATHSRAARSRRRRPSGTIEIEVGSGKRVRVDNEVDTGAMVVTSMSAFYRNTLPARVSYARNPTPAL